MGTTVALAFGGLVLLALATLVAGFVAMIVKSHRESVLRGYRR